MVPPARCCGGSVAVVVCGSVMVVVVAVPLCLGIAVAGCRGSRILALLAVETVGYNICAAGLVTFCSYWIRYLDCID